MLLNASRVAVVSSPLPRLRAMRLSYALLGPVCVGGALFGYVVLMRALLRGNSPTAWSGGALALGG